MADGIEFTNADTAGIPDTTRINTREEDIGPGPRHTQMVRLSLGRVDVWNGEETGNMADPDAATGAIPTGSYTSDQDSPIFSSPATRGALIWLETTVDPGGAETLSIDVYGISPTTGLEVKLYALGVLITAASESVAALIYPGALDADFFGKAVAGALPREWKFKVVHSAGGAWEYTATVTFLR